jgi:hypothetical protein
VGPSAEKVDQKNININNLNQYKIKKININNLNKKNKRN